MTYDIVVDIEDLPDLMPPGFAEPGELPEQEPTDLEKFILDGYYVIYRQ